MDNAIPKTIDIAAVLRSKMGSRARYVPRPVVSYLRHITHEDFVNQFLYEARELSGSDWLEACLRYLDITLEVSGEEHLPSAPTADGAVRPVTFVSNHPLGGIDGVALGKVIGRRYDDHFRYLVNDLLMFLPGLAPLCIPINKTGKQSRDFPRMVEAGFSGQDHLLMFPAGLCSRRRDGVVRDLEWKKTFVVKSVEHQRDIVPIHFIGQNSNFFYRLSNISDRLVKRVNIAMLYLVDEMYKNQHHTFQIHIGKPIPWQTFTSEQTPAQWADYVKQIVYQL